MSKYHERIAAFAAVQRDWTADGGIAEGLRAVLRLKGYGTEFQAWAGGVEADEEAVRTAIISEVASPPVEDEYRRRIQEDIRRDGEKFFGTYEAAVQAEPQGLMFEHGSFRHPVALDGFEVHVGAEAVEKRRNRRTKTEEKAEDRARRLKEKLEDTRNTSEDDYLAHAHQCGYLVRNTAVRFFAQIKGQFGTSVETQIRGVTLPELQEFVDSAGREALAGVSTHVDTSLEKRDEGGIKATHSDFAKAIIDFLNLEWEVDVDDIKRQHRESKSDSGFQPIEHWGAGGAAVLERLIDRRGNHDAGDVTAAFELGRESLKYGGA